MGGIRVIRADGDPFARGRTIGCALAGSIRESAAFNLDHFARRGLDRAAIERLAGTLLEATRRGLPAELAALQGMAAGAGLPLLDVLVPNAYEELDLLVPAPSGSAAPAPPRTSGRCSALTVVAPDVTLLGHDEQWLANEPAEIVLIVEVPDDPAEPAVVSPTCASWRPAVGMNAAGHAQAVMSLTAPDDRPGIPRVFVSRSVLGARDRADALRRAAPDGRSGGYAYLCARRGGDAFSIETTATRETLVDGPAAHANHCLDPGLAAAGDAPSTGSLARQARLEQLVAASHPRTAAEVMAILADHAPAPATICLHPPRTAGRTTGPATSGESRPPGDDAAEHCGDEGAEAVLFAMVCDLEAGRLWVAPGRPCETPFEAFDLADLVDGT